MNRTPSIKHGQMGRYVPVEGPQSLPKDIDRGHSWDDGVWSGVRQLVIFTHRRSFISAIHVEYDKGGSSCWSSHGHDYQRDLWFDQKDKVKLDYPGEFLISINGQIGPHIKTKGDAVLSLTFISNRNVYGPFGSTTQGTYFSSPSQTDCKIVGFFGKLRYFLTWTSAHLPDHSLTNIGVHRTPLNELNHHRLQPSNIKDQKSCNSIGQVTMGCSRNSFNGGGGGGDDDDDDAPSTKAQFINLSANQVDGNAGSNNGNNSFGNTNIYINIHHARISY